MSEDTFDFYIIYMQHPCDDPYYPPYVRNVGVFKSKELAIEKAKSSFDHFRDTARKYNCKTEELFYVEGDYYEDTNVIMEDRIKGKNNRQVFIIYDETE